jgi:GAF domain-containing protein
LPKRSELGADIGGVLIPRVGRLSRSTVRSALEVLRRRHGVADPETAFNVLRTVSQHHNVKLRDAVHGGLTIECHSGFDRDFLDFFGCVDDAGSACGATLSEARQVIVDDVETAAVFAEPQRAMVLAAGVRSVVSTPLLDERGSVRGVVSTHYAQPNRAPDTGVIQKLQLQADDCARWLSWYDRAVMPRVLAAVHVAAHAAAKTPAAPNPAVVGGD